MPNQWNDAGSGALQGVTNFLSGLFEGQAKKHARETYDLAMTNMKNLLQPVDNTNNDQISSKDNSDLLSSLYNINPGENVNGVPTLQVTGGTPNNITPITPAPDKTKADNNSPTNMLDAFYQGVSGLMDQGDYGKPYIPVLQSYYEANQPKTPETKTQIADGYLIKYDDNGNLLSRTKIADDKTKDYKIGNDWQIQDNGDGTYSYYKPTENGWEKTNNTASERDYQRQEGIGEFAPKTPKIGGGHIKVPKLDVQDASTKSAATDLFNTKRQIEGMGGWNAIQGQIDELNKVDKYDPNFKQAQEKLKTLNGLLDSYNSNSQTLKGLGVGDPDTFAESLGQGKDIKVAKQEQQQFTNDVNDVIYSKNGIYDQLISAWNLDSSKPEQATQIQSILTNLYNWMGQNIYGKVDYSLQKAIYDYVNNEVSKLAVSKGLK